jgi:hypothetical protein
VETVLLLALSVAMAVEAFAEVNDFGERARDAFGSNLGPSSSAAAPAGVKTLLVVAGAVLAGLVAMVLQLGGFHIMLGELIADPGATLITTSDSSIDYHSVCCVLSWQ